MRVFFNWFYWCVNVGALVALGLLAYVQQEISFFWGFLAPNVCLVIAVLVFTLGEEIFSLFTHMNIYMIPHPHYTRIPFSDLFLSVYTLVNLSYYFMPNCIYTVLVFIYTRSYKLFSINVMKFHFLFEHIVCGCSNLFKVAYILS